MRAIILSAGQGKRLLPLTENKPKCLVEVNNRTILEWQLDTLLSAGIEDFTIITGFQSRKVEDLILNKYKSYRIECVYNPFYSVSDNLASCWLAREKFYNEFLIINGDDIFETDLIKKLLLSKMAPVTVAVNIKEIYDKEDMKVIFNKKDSRLLRVGKDIECLDATGEAIGIHLFRKEGASLFKKKVENLMRDEKALKMWYLSAINGLVNDTDVFICDITGYKWAEVDFVDDVHKANELVKRFSENIQISKNKIFL
jgi:choline kinase